LWGRGGRFFDMKRGFLYIKESLSSYPTIIFSI